MTSTTLETSQRYTDGKRYWWLLGLVVPTLPLGGYFMVQATGLGVFWYWPLLFVYGVLPVLDWLIGTDENNPPESAVPDLENDAYYRWIVYLFVPLHLAVFIWGGWMFATGGLLWWEALGLALSLGGVAGLSINTAHELGHKKGAGERWLAKVCLAPVFYGHFFVEHNRGHHKNVATPEDPASSRMGESLYAFPAPHGHRQRQICMGHRKVPPGPARQRAVDPGERKYPGVADVRRTLGRNDRLARTHRDPIPANPVGVWLFIAGSRELPGTLRSGPPKDRIRSL